MASPPVRTLFALLPCVALAACAERPAPTVLTGASPVGGGGPALHDALAPAEVVYIGEVHDRAADHAYESAVIAGLVAAGSPVAVGWEMFDRTQTPLLDAFDAGQLSRAQLFARTGFERSWAAYSPRYARILEGNRRAGVRNVALNAPPGLAHKIAAGEALTAAERAQVPRGFKTSEKAFQNFAVLLGTHPGADGGSLRRYFAAQCVWDETMATAILAFHQAHPNVKLVVLTGRGHVSGGYGIPSFVRQKSRIRQLVLFPG